MNFTAAQREAIERSGNLMIVASPGSGKTAVLVEKVAQTIRKIPLEQLVVVTFTDRAGAELKQRLATRLEKPIPTFKDLSIGTLHAYLARLLRRFGTSVGIPDNFELLDPSLATLLQLRTCREELQTLLQSRFEEAIQFVDHWGFNPAIRLAAELIGREISCSDYAELLGRLNAAYQEKKRRMNCLDFNDLEQQGLRLLKEVRKTLHQEIKVIFFDEFQDISPIQWEILSHLHDPASNDLVLVGDPRQSIYRFRGADPKIFWQVAHQMKENGKVVYLDENFRSRPSVIASINRVIPTLFPDAARPLVATQPARPKTGWEWIRLNHPNQTEQEKRQTASEIALKVRDLTSQGVSWESIALLFRTRRSIPFFEEAFHQNRIPFQAVLGNPLLEQPEIISLLAFGRHCLEPTPLSTLMLDHSRLRGLAPIPTDPLPDFLEKTCSEASQRYEGNQVLNNIEAFRKLVTELTHREEIDLKSLLEILEGLRREEARIPCPDTESEGIRLLTVHASKGLEFPIVILADLSTRPSPIRLPYLIDESGTVYFKGPDPEGTGLKRRLSKSTSYEELEKRLWEADQEESRRLLYVALTRAREQIILPVSQDPSKPKGSWQSVLAGILN